MEGYLDIGVGPDVNPYHSFGTINPKPFRTFALSTTEHLNQRQLIRFFKYLTIGCGVPILMTLAIFLIDHFKVGSVLPEVGTFQCFLSPTGARYFFHIPITISLAFNTVSFFVTVCALWRRYKSNKTVSTNRRALVSGQVCFDLT